MPESWRTTTLVFATLVVGALVVAARAAQAPAVPQQTKPTFRLGVTAVPLDVRVIDGSGRAVTDLTRDDFTIFEDGAQQQIAHFSRQEFTAQPPGPGLRAGADAPVFDGSRQASRIFLIVIGGGALGSYPLGPGTQMVPDPSKSLDGLVHLLRDDLLPQDQVAVMAYNRATDFSANHERIATMLEAFRRAEADGIAALTAASAVTSVRAPAESVFATAPVDAPPPHVDLGFAEYVQAANRSTSDAESLSHGIRYLRFMAGEKHLIFLTAHGIVRPMPGTRESAEAKPWDDPAWLAAAANDARVTMHVIQTGGMLLAPVAFMRPLPIMMPSIIVTGLPYFGSWGPEPSGTPSAPVGPPQPGWDRPAPSPGVPVPGMNAALLEAISDLRSLARLTGGRAAVMTNARSALDRIDAETRVGYLLAYYPTTPAADGRYRSVRVEVNRPGVTVQFRHGYHADPTSATLSRRSVVADGRLVGAAASTRQSRGIPLTATLAFTKNPKGKGGDATVQLVVSADRLSWATDDLQRRAAHLELAIFCADARNSTVGQTRRTIGFALTAERYELALKQGLTYNLRIPVTSAPRFAKVVVYDYDADRTGSAVATFPKSP